MPSILLKNATYFLGDELHLTVGRDILIKDGRLHTASIQSSAEIEEIDVEGYLLLPGFIDAVVTCSPISEAEGLDPDIIEALSGDINSQVTLTETLQTSLKHGTTTSIILHDSQSHTPFAPTSPILRDTAIPFTSNPANQSTYVPIDTRPEPLCIRHLGGNKYIGVRGIQGVTNGDASGEHEFEIVCRTIGKKVKVADNGVSGKSSQRVTLLWGLRIYGINLKVGRGHYYRAARDSGRIENNSRADLLLIKLNPNWKRTIKGILLPLFLSATTSLSSSLIVLKTGTPVHAVGELAPNFQSITLANYYTTPNLPDSAAGNGEEAGWEFDSVEDAVEEIKKGNFVIVVDNEDRENEGDLVIAAEDLTPEKAGFMVRYTSGIICVPMLGERLDELELPLMVQNNTESLRTAYTISVDAKYGTTTGISAHDRSLTIKALSSPLSTPSSFTRPGHVFPLRYAPGGVLTRAGHTEASVDLCRLAGKREVAAICEIVRDDGDVMRRGELRVWGRRWGLKIVTISDLVKYRVRMEAGR
ncbi:hypothetical protein HDV00_008904 [Rhizophlyctis rosea]|nr:hypothetical protein HDV00_008904 [Rhizophlyctis rosea]